MKLRSGKNFSHFFKKENQPFRLILLPVRIPEKNEEYEVSINFDEASKQWRKNKVSVGGEGMFAYK